MPSFGKDGGSRNSHNMRFSGVPAMGLLTSPSLRTYTTNIGIWRGEIPMYARMLWITLASDSASFQYGRYTRFHDAYIIYVG